MARTSNTTVNQYYAACQRIRQAIPDPNAPPDDWPTRIIQAMRGIGGDAWIMLDEREGYRDLGPHFSLVRSVRNSPKFAPDFFKAINSKR